MLVAVLHFALALIALIIARVRMAHPMFQATAAELKKDREWLKEIDQRSRSNN
jgi:uncharacterized membrane protein YqjE